MCRQTKVIRFSNIFLWLSLDTHINTSLCSSFYQRPRFGFTGCFNLVFLDGNVTFERLHSFVYWFNMHFQKLFLRNFASQSLHLKGFIPLWTDSISTFRCCFWEALHHNLYIYRASFLYELIQYALSDVVFEKLCITIITFTGLHSLWSMNWFNSWGFLLRQLCKRQLFSQKFNCWL